MVYIYLGWLSIIWFYVRCISWQKIACYGLLIVWDQHVESIQSYYVCERSFAVAHLSVLVLPFLKEIVQKKSLTC